jgi:primary-amine oxidase
MSPRARRAAFLAAAVLLASAAFAAPHPLAPLTAAEIRDAVRIIRASGHAPASARFHFLALDEPPKDAVLRRAATPRRAFAVIYDRTTNRTGEAIADLSTGKLASWKEIPGAQPPVGEQDSSHADRLVRSDSRWNSALRARGIRDPNLVYTVCWPAGAFGLPGEEGQRVVRVTAYYAAGSNFYAHPVEGLAVFVDLTANKVLDFVDIDRNIPVPRQNAEFSADAVGALRPSAPPIQITTPDGPGYRIEDGEVRWQKWRFRFALHPREGLVLYTAGYEDGGRVRSVLYRASLSEMVVPYGDPGRAWFFRNTFDAGELGLGILASSLRPGVDCPRNCQVFDADFAGESGEPRHIAGAVGLYERETSIAWKHGEDTRRARDLVLFYSTEAGNYEYGFQYIFHQDGALEVKVLLTGIMSVKAVRDGEHDPYSHLVGKNTAAVHHQHFFNFRLDLDVDGPANRVVEMNSAAMPAGKDNFFGGAFTMTETVLATESQAQRRLSLDTSRKWIVTNPGVKNGLGHATGFALLPGENAVPFALPDSWIRRRAGFLNAHVWVTPYAESERYAAGDYPYQSKPGEGLPKWTAADRKLDNRDVVLWYTMGITHNPRPEDWPIMPVHEAGFKLVPWGFFDRNPALDLPPR